MAAATIKIPRCHHMDFTKVEVRVEDKKGKWHSGFVCPSCLEVFRLQIISAMMPKTIDAQYAGCRQEVLRI